MSESNKHKARSEAYARKVLELKAKLRECITTEHDTCLKHDNKDLMRRRLGFINQIVIDCVGVKDA